MLHRGRRHRLQWFVVSGGVARTTATIHFQVQDTVEMMVVLLFLLEIQFRLESTALHCGGGYLEWLSG